jgi:hypothetical protein
VDSPQCHDPQIWKGIQAVFALFDEKDMSSDETETEAMFGVSKEVRRIRKHWIDTSVTKVRYSHLGHNVDDALTLSGLP